MRIDNRKSDQLRDITIEKGVSRYAEGSCLIKFGNTHVLCTATVEETVPPFIKGTGAGWVTAEYGMLPRSTHSRMRREVNSGKPSGRTQEIQRLIGRSLRNAVDLKALGERQIIIDCDVIQADGGTRTAAITGGYVALNLACQKLVEKGLLRKSPITKAVAAVSVGILHNEVILDLNYEEDSSAEVDSNYVMSSNGDIIEVQATGEEKPFTREQLLKMMDYAEIGIKQLFNLQNQVL